MASSNACGRHISISSHLAGYSGRMSFYVMDESELILGTALDGIANAARRVIAINRPRILLVYVCCSTYISGLDNERIRGRLARENPGTDILVIDMNPVAADTSNPPAVATQRKIIGLLNFSDVRDDAVNLLGSDSAPEPGCELYGLLRSCGVREIRHLTLCKDYDDFLRMGEAGLNLVLSAKAIRAAKDILNAKNLVLLPTYSVRRANDYYEQISEALGTEIDTEPYAESALEAVDRVLDKVRGLTIAVGSTATEMPFGLARSLHEYGFDIRSVFHSGISASERADAEYLMSEIPGLEIYDCSDPSMRPKVGRCGEADISIGYNAAYFARTKHSADVVLDRGMFGFSGIRMLMEKIEESLTCDEGLVRQVEGANLVI